MSVQLEVMDGIAHVAIKSPPMNAVSRAVRQGLLDAVQQISTTPHVAGVLLSGTGDTFMVSADENEIDEHPEAPRLPDVIAAIETSPTPWLAAINGVALGAGLEIALGCRWRLASRTASLGLPAVTLGLIPGAGGTVRTPRLVGVEAAVDLVTSGKPISAIQAKAIGIIDEALPTDDFLTASVDWLKTALVGKWPTIIASRSIPPPPPEFWHKAQTRVSRAAKGSPAPIEALASIKNAAESSFDGGMAEEYATFTRLRRSDQAAALRYVFSAECASSRPPELQAATPRRFRELGVVGGGTMGVGIAAAILNAGLAVRMVERDEVSAERGRSKLTTNYDSDLKQGRISPTEHNRRLSRFTASTTYDDLSAADIVIEAVFEDLDVKRAVFAELARICRPDAILATNTSYLDPREIFRDVEGQDRLIGLHFFSPAHIMKLLEIVPTADTSDDVIASAFALAEQLAKVPVRAGICDGFIGNRILRLYREQGERLLMRGALPAQIDTALRKFGMAMGVFDVQDLAGLDIGAYQRKAARSRGEAPYAPVADRLVEMGRLGRKAQAGWYDYDGSGTQQLGLPQVVANAIAAERERAGHPPKSWSDAQIVEAMILPLINEAARIVEEHIAMRPSDIDLVLIHGYGFPRFRGGLVRHGRLLGYQKVVSCLQLLQGEGMAPEISPRLQSWAIEQAGEQ